MDLLARENLLLYSLNLDVKIWPQFRQVTGTLKKWAPGPSNFGQICAILDGAFTNRSLQNLSVQF